MTSRTMTFEDLEPVYERLATAIDEASDNSERFLAKLALMLAHELGDPERTLAAIEACLQDLHGV